MWQAHRLAGGGARAPARPFWTAVTASPRYCILPLQGIGVWAVHGMIMGETLGPHHLRS